MTLAELAQDLFSLTLSPAQAEAFDTYARLLTEWNGRMNLTAITDPEGITVRHFLDSLSVAHAVPLAQGARVIDVGTGGGFPGLPLKIVRPDLHVTLMEATGKKLTFLKEVCAQTGLLDGVEFLHARAEEAGHMPGQRASYDLAVARAVARMPVLLEYLLPLVKVGGLAVAMKGATAHAETEDAARAMSRLGGRAEGIDEIRLPGVNEPHYLVKVRKAAPSPASYPRKPGTPSSSPL
jgi:16S rRNA (guanine527-N7)-methyltransferase